MSIITFTFDSSVYDKEVRYPTAASRLPTPEKTLPSSASSFFGFSSFFGSNPESPKPTLTATTAKELCPHTTVSNGLCLQCNLFLTAASTDEVFEVDSGYSSFHSHAAKSRTSSFERELKTLQIPDDVKAKIIEMDLSANQSAHRMGVRRSQLFSYVHAAYQALGYKIDVGNISQQLGLNQKEINSAARIISGTSAARIELVDSSKRSLVTPIVVISPLSMIRNVCERNGLLEHYPWIAELGKRVLTRSDTLLDHKPEHIALAIVKYYTGMKGITIANFAKVNGLTEATLKQRVCDVAHADNV